MFRLVATNRTYFRITFFCSSVPVVDDAFINPDLSVRCLEYILEEINHNRMANVMVASHNEDTVKFTLEKWVQTRKIIQRSIISNVCSSAQNERDESLSHGE